MLDSNQQARIEDLAWKIRYHIIEMTGVGKAGHIGGSCSAADIVAALYGWKMKHDPQNPHWPERDRFVMSKGHAALAQYAALAACGYFPEAELRHVKKLNGMLQGHPDLRRTPGIEANSGSLGQGLSIGVGMALGLRLDHLESKVFVMLGDGELAEGQVWEAAMAAANFKLDNLVGLLDCNRIQATGEIAQRFNTYPFTEKWQAFGWQVIEIDGHDVAAVCAALEQADQVSGRPTMIVAHTVKGKGIPFAENTAAYHNGILTEDLYRQALVDLEQKRRDETCCG
ncbi:MAG: transketolase [Clostridiaceae bacterium]|nr:transketolase [Clostridiaceae bacterium]